MTRIVRAYPQALVVPVVLLFFYLALSSLIDDSPTMDEQNHLARGLAYLRTGDPRLSLEHPPLVNTISALPLLTMPDIRIPTDHPSWDQKEGWYAFAEQLLWVYNHDVERMVFLARLPIVFVALGLALVGYRLAITLWGKTAGIVAFVFLLFDPNIMAHGRYSTTDVGGSAFLLLMAWLLWRLWNDESGSWRRLLAAGLGIGLALGSKMSNLLFLPIFGLLSIFPLYGRSPNRLATGRRLGRYILAVGLGFLTLWTIFSFEWRPFIFQSTMLAGLNRINGPMPTYWAGVEQIALISGGGRPSFLLGNFSTEGWWYYFPVAFLVKTPVVILILFLLAIVFLLADPLRRKRAIFLFVPAGLYFVTSMFSNLNIGYRHLLPALAFLYVSASGLVKYAGQIRSLGLIRRTVSMVLLFGALVAVILTNLIIYPHYLSFFNLVAGGPANGHNVLVDSNIDWGQDLLRLKEWMDRNEVDDIRLSWFGTADPEYYGIDYEPLPGLPRHFDLWWDVPFDPLDPEPGIYAISVSNLWELPLEEKNVFKWFRDRRPDDRVGYSILIYDVRNE